VSPKESERIEKAYLAERKKLLGFIRKRMPGNLEAEDILQDVFYQLTLGFRDIDRIRNLTAWLYRVAENRIIDHFRKKRATNSFSDSIIPDGVDGPLSLEEILPSIGSSPDDEELKGWIWETITEVLAELPEEQSEVFIATEFEDMSFKEISERTGVGVNTLLSRKRYAVMALRKRLNQLYKLFKNT
jgi:RNA polymerase sigma factor (sigma-70 family)